MKVKLMLSSGLGRRDAVVEMDDTLAKHLIAQNKVEQVGKPSAAPAPAPKEA